MMRLWLTVALTCAASVASAQPRVYVLDSGVNLSGVTLGPNYAGGTHTDCHGHGTAMASISGIPPTAITSVRIFNCWNSTVGSSLEDGIAWVASNAVAGDMVMLAVNTHTTNPDMTRDDLINASTANGVTWVVAAGNKTDWTFWYSPARIDAAIVVAAADGLTHASYSNFGGTVDLYADGCVSGWCGTSVSTALISGQVYDLLQQMPWAPPSHISNTLISNCFAWMVNPGPGTTSCKR